MLARLFGEMGAPSDGRSVHNRGEWRIPFHFLYLDLVAADLHAGLADNRRGCASHPNRSLAQIAIASL
jgi:hypothetical protein